jgi:YfiH family protein
MIVQQSQGLSYFQFPDIASPSVVHGVFTRLGGVSRPPWDSLNLGGTVGDDPTAVRENLARLVSAVGFNISQLAQVRQIHSAKTVRIDRPVDALKQADAMITSKPGLLLLMRFADCVPILFSDPENKAVGIAHAGWQGTLKGVASQVVTAMVREYGSDPAKLVVGIGPSIGPDHYQIGPDVSKLVVDVYGKRAPDVLEWQGDDVKFNLWEANKINLEMAGVRNIDVGGICTGCHLDLWFSHRAENGRTGRFAAVIGLM